MIGKAVAVAATSIAVPAALVVWIITRSGTDYDRMLDAASEAMRRRPDDDWAATSACIHRINHPTNRRDLP